MEIVRPRLASKDIEVDLLSPTESIKEYAETMARAFADYPVMRRAFAAYPDSRREWIARMVSWSESVRQLSGSITPVARIGNRIVGGVNVILPDDAAIFPHEDWFTEFLEEAGPVAQDFFPRFLRTVDTIHLPQPYVLLGMLGVDPEFQGCGIGRRLVDRVIEIASHIPDCLGVGLDTESEATVRLYESCGFSIAGQTSIEDMPIWVMWRPVG